MKLRKELWFGFSLMAAIIIPVIVLMPWSHLTNGQLGLMMLALICVGIMLGFPAAFTLMGMGVFFAWLAYRSVDPATAGRQVLDLFVQRTYGVMSNDVLIAVPLFLFMGYLVERAQLIDKLFKSLHLATARLPGSLAVATIVTCAIFATATGIVGAVVTLMGLLAFPAMLKAGYDTKLSAGVVAAGGCLGILIPPSIMLILYGAMASTSVVRLYAGAFLPGFLLAGLYMLYVIGRAMLNPRLAPKLPKEQTDIPMGQLVKLLASSFFPLAFLILAVLGAILFGLATPNEAAAFGAFGSILLAIGYGQFNLQRLKEAVFLTARTAAMVCWLFVGSWTFSSVFSYLGGQAVVENFILSLNMTPVTFMLLTQFIIFLLGWPLEWTEIIIIFVPIFLPLLHHFNIDPVFFGVMVALNIQTSFLTPPMAMACYYLKGVAPKHVTLNQIFAGALPFVFMVFITMFLVYVFPQIAMWLPDAIYH